MRQVIVCLFATIVLCGCNSLSSLENLPFLAGLKREMVLEQLVTLVEEDANNRQPFRFHIILTTSLQMSKELSTMTAETYFKKYANKEFERLYFNQYSIYPYELIPGKPAPERKIKLNPQYKYVDGYFFASLVMPQGAHRVAIPSDKRVVIRFDKTGMFPVMTDSMNPLESIENKFKFLLGGF